MTHRLVQFLAILLLACGIGAPGAAIAQGQAAPAAVAPGYVLGVGDTIDVSVADSADFKGRATVEQDGTVVLPLVGRVSAAGQSVLAFRDAIRQRLVSGGYFLKPEVSVSLVSATSRYVTVLGEVNAPGLVPLDRDYRLSEAVARVGGVKGAGVDTITLTRSDGTSQNFSLRAIATSGGSAADPVLGSGDKVFVAPAEVFYIYGQVGSPGTYPVDPGMTVRQALARGGGLTALGTERKIRLTRGDRELRVRVTDRIQPGDTLVVGQRFF